MSCVLNAFRYSDEDVASIILQLSELVEDDAKPLLIAHLYQVSYETDQIGALFNLRIKPVMDALKNINE